MNARQRTAVAGLGVVAYLVTFAALVYTFAAAGLGY